MAKKRSGIGLDFAAKILSNYKPIMGAFLVTYDWQPTAGFQSLIRFELSGQLQKRTHFSDQVNDSLSIDLMSMQYIIGLMSKLRKACSQTFLAG